jgi:hypothetical protein
MNSYVLFNVSVEHNLAEAFKAVCSNAKVSTDSEISDFIVSRTCALAGLNTKSAKQVSYDTRRKRRHLLTLILYHLEAIKKYEDIYRENIPDNLQTGSAYESAEQAVDILEEAIDLLTDIY